MTSRAGSRKVPRPAGAILPSLCYITHILSSQIMSPKAPLPLTVEHALLGLLVQRPMHGYELHQQLLAPEGPGIAWRAKQPHVYAMLGRLEAEGLIAVRSRPQRAHPARRVFHLTEKGKQAFRARKSTRLNSSHSQISYAVFCLKKKK